MRRFRNLQFAICNLQFAIVSGLLFLLCFPAPAMAQARPGRSLDDELLKNLKAQSKSQIERELFGPDEKKDKPQAGAGQGGDDLNRRLRQELGAAAEKENDNPLLNIAQNMSQVHERISQSDAGPATLNLQKQIVADLDLLINQACKSAGQCSSGACNAKQSARKTSASCSKPGAKAGQKPGNKPAGARGTKQPGGEADKADMDEMRSLIDNLWGELPAHVREQMLQSPMEDFIPKYHDLIEDYFRDLSNEKKSGE